MRFVVLLLVLLLGGCGKEPSAPEPNPVPGSPVETPDSPSDTPGEKPLSATQSLLKVSFDLSEVSSDVAKLSAKVPPTRSGGENVRFRLVYELTSEQGIHRADTLFDIAGSVIALEDTLEYGQYTLAVFGNYVFVDESGGIVDEQYVLDEELGLQKVTIADPEEEKTWAFAYSGTESFSVSSAQTQLQVPIARCVMQIQFNRHGPYDNFDWNDVVASNITLTDFSTCYDVYTGEGFCDPDRLVIALRNIDNTSYSYYRLTLFESLQDCYIDLQYVNADGSTIDLPQFYNKRKLFHEDFTGKHEIYKHPFERNYLLFFSHIWNDEEPFSIGFFAELMGDGQLFVPTEASCVDPSDSLALVDFYRALNGPRWVQPWNLQLPVSTWAGVTLSPVEAGLPQRVVKLVMGKGLETTNTNNMRGYVPSSLGRLSELTELVLSADMERIDDFLDGLPKLERLTISHSQRANFIGGYERPTLRLSEAQTLLEKVVLEGVEIENLNVIWGNEGMTEFTASFVYLPEDYVVMDRPVHLPALTSFHMDNTTGGRAISDCFYRMGAPLTNLQCSGSLQLRLSELIGVFPNLQYTVLALDGQRIPDEIVQWTSLVGCNLMGDIRGSALPLFQMPNLTSIMIQAAPELGGFIPKSLQEGKQISIWGTAIVLEE